MPNVFIEQYTSPAFTPNRGVVDPGPSNGEDDTDALQEALATGLAVDTKGRHYFANNLEQTVDDQVVFSSRGVTQITKNGNGVLFGSTGDRVQVRDVVFRGESADPTHTGDTIESNGSDFALINCGSRWAYGRAALITGQHAQILGTADIYESADDDDYDIVIGESGVASLYHQLEGVITTDSGGGIKLIDTGSHTIVGGQFGKLYIAKGTGPSGVNGGKTLGARILGTVLVEASSAIFEGNQFGADADFTFAADTSGCRLGLSNTWAGSPPATVTNNGNANNYIAREISTGSTTTIKIGADDSVAIYAIHHETGVIALPNGIVVPNNKNVDWTKSAGGAAGGCINITTADNFQIQALIGALQLLASGQPIQFVIGSLRMQISSSGVVKIPDLAGTGTRNVVANSTGELSAP